MKIKNLFKNVLQKADANADAYAQAAEQAAKQYTDGNFIHMLSTSSITYTTEDGAGYLIIAPSGSWANVYFANNYQGACYTKTLIQGGSSVTISTSGANFTINSTAANKEFYAIKIHG